MKTMIVCGYQSADGAFDLLASKAFRQPFHSSTVEYLDVKQAGEFYEDTQINNALELMKTASDVVDSDGDISLVLIPQLVLPKDWNDGALGVFHSSDPLLRATVQCFLPDYVMAGAFSGSYDNLTNMPFLMLYSTGHPPNIHSMANRAKKFVDVADSKELFSRNSHSE